MNSELTRLHRWMVIMPIVGILLCIVIFLVILPLAEQSGKLAYLDILVMPLDTEVKIDGQSYRNAVYEFEPGAYTATVTRDGSEPQTLELELAKNQTTGLYLTLNDDGWRQYTMEEMKHKNSLASATPIYFSICGTPAKRTNCDAVAIEYDRAKQCDYARCVVISGRSAELRDNVLAEVEKQLSDKGYSLSDYQYFYEQNDER